jgi:dipeptidyl aminopeptidase/acylaminoacyl peptidase
MLRTLDVVDGSRMGLVGGSIGGCVALRAAPYIPNLAAVVAFVPPTSWKDLIAYHRNRWQPAVELACNGEPREWAIGGPQLADALESVICGHAACSDAEFLARSPLPLIQVQTAPTLIVSAELDNVVPLDQQLLWSLFRQGTGHPVSVVSVDPCDPPGTPPLTTDVHVLARRSFHLLSSGPISSGMLFLMAHLDRAGAR